MKTFLFHLFVFFIPFIIFLPILSFMADDGLKNTNYITYKQWSRLSKEKPVNANLLILGNSRASCHVDPAILDRHLPVHSYNLGLLGASLVLQLQAVCNEAGFTWSEKFIPFVKYIGTGKLLIDGLLEYCGLVKSDYGGFASTYSRGYMLLNGSFSVGGGTTSDTVLCDLSLLESFLSVCRDRAVKELVG